MVSTRESKPGNGSIETKKVTEPNSGDSNDTITVAQNKRKRNATTDSSLKRRRITDATLAIGKRPLTPSRKRKENEAARADEQPAAPQRKRNRRKIADPDQAFLRAAKTQLKRTQHEDNNNENILAFLRLIESPASRRILRQYSEGDLIDTESIDAYYLSPEVARRLLASNQ